MILIAVEIISTRGGLVVSSKKSGFEVSVPSFPSFLVSPLPTREMGTARKSDANTGKNAYSTMRGYTFRIAATISAVSLALYFGSSAGPANRLRISIVRGQHAAPY
jgi:hypothetical protein